MIKKSKSLFFICMFSKHKHITLNINLVMHYILRRQIPKWEPSYNLPFFVFFANINSCMWEFGIKIVTNHGYIIYHKVFIKSLVIDD